MAPTNTLVDNGSEFQVNTDESTSANGNQSIATLVDGNVVSIWQSGPSIQGQLLDPAGNHLGSQFVVSANGDALYASVAALSTGGFIVAYQAPLYNNNNVSVGTQFAFQKFDANGTAAGSEVSLAQNGNGIGSLQPMGVEGLAGGGFVVAYLDNVYQSVSGSPVLVGSQIRIEQFDSSNNVVQTSFVGSSDSAYPHIAALTGGGYAVAWSNYAAVKTIETQAFDSSGAPVGATTSVVKPGGGDGLETGFTHNIAGLPDGGFVVVWDDGNGWGQVLGQVHLADGSVAGDPFVVSSQAGQNPVGAMNPAVSALSNGNFLVTWEQSTNGSSEYDIHAQAFNAAGHAISDEAVINTVTDRWQFLPEVTTLTNDRVLITWNDQSYHWGTNGQNIAGQVVDLACFMAGTMIRTSGSEVAVETLRPGDLVVTTDGRIMPVSWIGRQTVSMRFADKLRVLPIRIMAGALAENVPSRDLLLSPDHAILIDDVLIQAGGLVNGTSIFRETNVRQQFTYYHVELDDHSLILAENTPAETFIDNVDRLGFDNWQEHEALYPQGKPIVEMPYPRAEAHRQVPRAIREQLAERAATIGIVSEHAVA